jgi:hypothetical protein
LKKRKSDDDLNMLDVDLQDFNYEAMENMKLDPDQLISDEETSDEIST